MQHALKYSLAFTSLLAAGLHVSGCSSEDSDPPPVAPVNVMSPGNAAGGSAPTGGPGPSAAAGGSAPTGLGSGAANNEGLGGAILSGMGGAPAGGGSPDGMGMNGGSSAMNAAGGAGGAAPGELTLEELVGGVDGHLFTVACGDTPNADDCNGEGWRSNGGPLNLCAGGRLDARINFPIAGEPGSVYGVRLHFYGVMEPRNYGAVVTREAQGRPSLAPGGTPTPFASMNAGAGEYLSTGDNNYNTYELHVLDQAGQEVRIYFLNADTQTDHYTMGISYEQTLELIGGGTLRLQIADANCRQIKNCGAGTIPCRNKAQEIDISAASPQPPANALQQPGLGKDPEHSGQWFLMDALSFEAR